MIYLQQNNAIKKSIKDIYNQIERLVFSKINSNDNNFYPIPRARREEINNIKYDAIETEQQKITSRKNEDIKKGNNSYREVVIFEDKKEEIREQKRYNSSKREKIISKESLIKPYIEGKVNFEQAFIKRFKNKMIDDKKNKDLKKYPLEYNDNKNINVNYSDIVMNIYNNQGIKNIYNTKFKEEYL